MYAGQRTFGSRSHADTDTESDSNGSSYAETSAGADDVDLHVHAAGRRVPVAQQAVQRRPTDGGRMFAANRKTGDQSDDHPVRHGVRRLLEQSVEAGCYAGRLRVRAAEGCALEPDRQRYRVAHFGHPGFTRSEVGDNFPRWLKQGFKADGPAGCNTWAAPATASKIS
jgi:hypothetical protein